MVRIVAADLSDDQERGSAIAAAESAGVDLVINNAGVGRLGRVIDNTPERESEMVKVNALTPRRDLPRADPRHAAPRRSEAG